MTEYNVPDGWGADSLSEFIELANRNTLGVFVKFDGWFARLQRIDRVFVTFSSNLLNTSTFYEPLLFVRAHSSYRGAVRLAMSGQIPEAFSLIRGTLEYALYGFHLNVCPEDVSTWLARDDTDIGKKNARRNLTPSKMLSELETHDSNLGKAAKHLYELSIDTGAHPNRKTITLAMDLEETDERMTLNLAQLNVSTPALTLVLKTSVQVGVCALNIFKLVFPERFELLRISDELLNLAEPVDGIPL
jgi:hypothetical protein